MEIDYMINKKRISVLNNRGTTMLETLISFLVLVIVLAALYSMIRFSSNLRMRAIDTANVKNEFNQEIYKTSVDNSKVQSYYYIGKNADDNITMFSLKPDMEKTAKNNWDISNGENTVYNFSRSVKIPTVDATAYVSKDKRIDDENLVRPKVLVFHYNK